MSALSNLGIVAGGMASSAIWTAVNLRLAASSTLVAVALARIAMAIVPPDRPAAAAAPAHPAAV